MNKYLAILGILVLVGAGCAVQQTTQTDVETEPKQEENSDQGIEQQVEIKSEETGETNGTTQTIKLDDGTELIVEAVDDEEEESTEGEDLSEEEEENIIEVELDAEIDQTVSMETNNFSLKPNTITAKAGDRIKVTFAKNSGFHTFVIDEIGLKTAVTQGESIIFTAPPKNGTYAFYCDIGSHRSQGMEGTLIIK